MLGTDDAPGDTVEADPLDDLRRALERGIGGGNGNGGGKGGGGNGGGDGGGDDPMRHPIDGRVLVYALKQMADFVSKAILVSMEKQTDFNSKTTQTLVNEIGDARKDGIELNQQLHANIMQGLEQITRLASASADSFEAFDRRIRALEAELALLKGQGLPSERESPCNE
jgi:hypothetical protein